MQSSDPTAAARPRRRLLRVWAVVSAVYVLIAAAGSAAPLKAAVGHALTAPAPAPQTRAAVSGGPIPEAPDSPSEMMAKALGLETLLLLGPPLLLLWLGWDVWFALAGFFPGLSQGSEPAVDGGAD